MDDALHETDAFENPQTPREALPDYRELEFEPVAERFRGYTVITTLLYWLPFVLVGTAMNFLPDLPLLAGLLIPGGVLLLAVLIGIYRWVDAGHRGWAVRAHDIAAKEGIFWRSVTTLPFARIQHVETSSGPVERWRGLARLKLFTAGGITADLTLIGLDAEAADTLREHLAEQIRLRDALASDDGDRRDELDA
ncbi:PH domain-containing protein [Wenzhouxiangella sp. XN79A]|uniref:PH domain-containing protein n=1 Tax=Wenzhouxiangella sp. XN79A TaxID=2724193 RepID=UPI00144AB2B8|nr:PH domain-containing protein [Wenzhouxiangella sp. XN79A]NKI35785.1 PH domain-containing protein [Wenzhouxiangella sp. XN79A]